MTWAHCFKTSWTPCCPKTLRLKTLIQSFIFWPISEKNAQWPFCNGNISNRANYSNQKYWNRQSRQGLKLKWKNFFLPTLLEPTAIFRRKNIFPTISTSLSLYCKIKYFLLKLGPKLVRAANLRKKRKCAKYMTYIKQLGSRRWNWKFREKHFWNPNPELLLHSSYSFWLYLSTSGSGGEQVRVL